MDSESEPVEDERDTSDIDYTLGRLAQILQIAENHKAQIIVNVQVHLTAQPHSRNALSR